MRVADESVRYVYNTGCSRRYFNGFCGRFFPPVGKDSFSPATNKKISKKGIFLTSAIFVKRLYTL